MDIYIDKSSFISLMTSERNSKFEDALRVLKKQLNIFFNFEKPPLEDDPDFWLYYDSFTMNMGKDNLLEFSHSFPEKPIKSNHANDFNQKQLSAVYLLEDENAYKLKASGGVLVGLLGEEIETISRLFLRQDDYSFEKRFNIRRDLKSWSVLSDFSMPLTDIIIVDTYIISDISLIETNLCEFLKVLCSESRTSVNIVIYTNSQNSVSYENISQNIRKKVKEATGKSPKLTIVTYTMIRGLKSRAEHDRTIFTNYIRVYSGDSLNYFDHLGNVITTGREINYSCLANRENHILAEMLIEDIQKNIDFLISSGRGIHGDKSSGFLKMS